MSDCLFVAICSVLKHTDRPIDLIVLHSDLSEDLLYLITGAFYSRAKHPKCIIRFEHIQLDRFKGLLGLHENHTTYARLLLGDLLPELSKVIYLDCDIVITRDITNVWMFDMKGMPLAGVSHTLKAESIEQGIWDKHKICKESPYYNAGVLLINLDAWRSERVIEKFMDYFTSADGLPSAADQTALNVVFDQRWSRAAFGMELSRLVWRCYAAWRGIRIIAFCGGS